MLWVHFAAAGVILLASSGCTSLKEYLDNGFKVGPNYCKPDAPVAQHWIDEADIRVREGENLSKWWTVFNDDRLNYLIHHAYRQNINLKQFAFQVLAARAQLGIIKGEFFPTEQDFQMNLRRVASPTFNPTDPKFSTTWNYGFNLQWELDFWGRLRRNIASFDAKLDASVENYDAVLVTLLGDVATNYVKIRTLQERIALLKANVEVQKGVLAYIDNRYKAGFKVNELDLDQATSNLRQTESAIPALEIQQRQFEDALCIDLGMPPRNLDDVLGAGAIPTAPLEVAIGIPADLLRRRPDVRQAERVAAAQAEQIGFAKAQFYPLFSLNGSVGYAPDIIRAPFSYTAFTGTFGPSFAWDLLLYGRIINNVRLQDATFQQDVAVYQQSVLTAAQEVEDGLALFLRSQRQTKLLDESVVYALKAVKIVILQYQVGAVDFNRYATIEQAAVTQQDSDAQARGNIALGLISVYTAMGGGWEIRLGNEAAPPMPPITQPLKTPGAKNPPEEVPAPQTDVPKAREIPPMPPKDLPKAREILPMPPKELPKPHEDVTVPMDDVPGSPDKTPQLAPNPPQSTKAVQPQ